MVTAFLIRLAGRIMPTSSKETFQIVRPASFSLSRQADDALGLAMLWGGLAIFAGAIMGALSVLGNSLSRDASRDGLDFGFGLMWFAIAGLVLASGRYLAAEMTARSIERAYFRASGRSSLQSAATGNPVTEVRHRLLLTLTRSSDWDLACQAIAALIVCCGG
jgi:hypothetical protein